MSILVLAVDQPSLAPFRMPDRFRHDVIYFATSAGTLNAPAALGEREYWIRQEDARQIFDDGVITIVSPLDSAAKTELEITEEHERWLEWMLEHQIQHIRLG